MLNAQEFRIKKSHVFICNLHIINGVVYFIEYFYMFLKSTVVAIKYILSWISKGKIKKKTKYDTSFQII